MGSLQNKLWLRAAMTLQYLFKTSGKIDCGAEFVIALSLSTVPAD